MASQAWGRWGEGVGRGGGRGEGGRGILAAGLDGCFGVGGVG